MHRNSIIPGRGSYTPSVRSGADTGWSLNSGGKRVCKRLVQCQGCHYEWRERVSAVRPSRLCLVCGSLGGEKDDLGLDLG